jgi:hypothetical protein
VIFQSVADPAHPPLTSRNPPNRDFPLLRESYPSLMKSRPAPV